MIPILDEILPFIRHILNYSISYSVLAWKDKPRFFRRLSSHFHSSIFLQSPYVERLIYIQLMNFLSRTLILSSPAFNPGTASLLP